MSAPAWRDVAAWLRANGFEELPINGGHAHFRHPPTGIKVTTIALGRRHDRATPGEFGTVLRELERAGFDRREVRRALGLR